MGNDILEGCQLFSIRLFIFDTFTFFSDKIGDIFFVTWSMQTGF